jgi:DNA polymerase-4
LTAPISTTLTLAEVAEKLAWTALHDNDREREITLLAISVSHLRPEHSLQLELAVVPTDLADRIHH